MAQLTLFDLFTAVVSAPTDQGVTEMAKYTYMRPANHTHGGRHTCPACLRPMKTTKSGRMIRHGWKEEGRQVGVFGGGYQWGACNGVGDQPLQVTDLDGLRHHAAILAEAERADAAAADYRADTHATLTQTGCYELMSGCLSEAREDLGAEVLAERLAKKCIHDEENDYENCRSWGEMAAVWGVTIRVRIRRRRHNYGKSVEWVPLIDVPRGFSGVRGHSATSTFLIKSYAELRDTAAAQLDREAEILREHAAQLMAAMEKARKADDKPAAEKKAACVHKASTWRRTDRLVGRCNRWAMRTPYNQRTTENDAEVTCKRCLKSLKKGA